VDGRQRAAAGGARVLLVEEGWNQTLYLARALEEAGHDVTVVTANGSTASYRRRTVHWSSVPPVASARFVEELDRLMAERPFDHVLPLTEAAMQRLWDASPPWSDRIFPATAGWQRRLLRDKHLLLEYMAARGVEVPRQRRIDAAFDPGEAAREIGLPAVVKEAGGVAGTRVCVVETRPELERAVARARELGGAWVVQEYVAGSTYLFGGVFHEGRALRVYAAEKLELHPPRTGPAIRLRSDDHAALVGLGCRVLHELQWTGLASLDCIRRPDGRHVLLEVNPRPWGSIGAATSAGVELFAPFAALLAGAVPRADLAFAANREYMVFPRYLLSPTYRSVGGVVQALRDLCAHQGREWRHPGFLRHIFRRLYRVRRQQLRLV
jgi:predicted ATP-grasp superfamily ATP-dependent carboligase